jgi:hypothetical protein
MKLSFDEIVDWREFESLVASYFRELKEINTNVVDVKVQPSGEGNDGGRDILVTVQLTDSFTTFTRTWVVQCKFNGKPVGKSILSAHNIPTVIHQHGASGYLLVCKGDVSSRLSDMFEDLNKNCTFKYCYDYWNGEQFKDRIETRPNILRRYFPKFNRALERRQKKAKI